MNERDDTTNALEFRKRTSRWCDADATCCVNASRMLRAGVMSCIPSWRTRARGLLPILRVCERRQVLYSTSTIHSYKPRHGASRRAGLISTHRFPVSLLLFHNHRSLPVAIRGSHPSLLYPGCLTLPFTLLLFHPFSSFPAPPSFPLSPHSSYICL